MIPPHVSILIPHHYNDNQGYLDRCLQSVLASVGVSFDVTVIADTEVAPVIPVGVALIWDKNLNTATKKGNYASKLAQGPNLLWLSDDVMVSKHMIAALSDSVYKTNSIVNPYSNNDVGSYYWAEPALRPNQGAPLLLKHNMQLQELAGYEQCVIDYPRSESILITVPWIPFYCTMVSKAVFEYVGDLDEKLDSRHNDEDFCIRARNKGVRTMVNLGVFALHFGGKTLDRSVTMQEREDCTRYFVEKWGLQAQP